jgi:hypothetical protein
LAGKNITGVDSRKRDPMKAIPKPILKFPTAELMALSEIKHPRDASDIPQESVVSALARGRVWLCRTSRGALLVRAPGQMECIQYARKLHHVLTSKDDKEAQYKALCEAAKLFARPCLLYPSKEEARSLWDLGNFTCELAHQVCLLNQTNTGAFQKIKQVCSLVETLVVGFAGNVEQARRN